MRQWLKRALWLVLVTMAGASSAATYRAGSLADLTTRINSAVAGDEIILSNGTYTASVSITITRTGTAANPILIRADSIGGVEITGSSGFKLSSPAAYITIQGFKFTHAASISVPSGTSHCRFTRNVVELTIPAGSDVSYFNISGDDAEIDHNELRNKSTLGEMLDVAGSGNQVARRLWVHHNYFHDFTSPGGNGAETIRLGLSGLSLSTGNALVEYNLFVRCDGENEMISNKSSGNTYRYNTVLDCPGGEISQRHGNDCLYYGNYMRNTQGMRIYGDRHKIFSNYFESNSIGVNMGNGDGDVYNGAELTAHDRPDDNVVVFNTFINNSTHYQMGGRTDGLGSSNTIVANNLFQGGGSIASISGSAPYTGSWAGNIRWQTSSTGNMPANGYTMVNPLLAKDANGIYHLQSGSPAIAAAIGAYAFVTVDMDGQPRDSSLDVGADEFSAAPMVARILTTNDVGPFAGLTNQVSTPVVSPNGGNFPTGPISITITSATSGASIRYTLNGATPTTTSGTLYTGAISLGANATLQALAYKNGLADSTAASAIFTFGGPLAFEAEAINSFTNGATAALQNDTNNTEGHWLAFLATGTGQYIDYVLPNIPAGVYTLQMSYKAHPNRGIVRFSLDGAVLGSDLDQYSNPQTYPTQTWGHFTFSTAGNHVARLVVAGKNPAAGAYTLSVDQFILTAMTPPIFAGVKVIGSNVVFSVGQGMAGTGFNIRASTNLLLSPNNWPLVRSAVFDNGGVFNWTNAIDRTAPCQFYLLQVP